MKQEVSIVLTKVCNLSNVEKEKYSDLWIASKSGHLYLFADCRFQS